jgi:enoyl-CoA hydratase/carnithine racemase
MTYETIMVEKANNIATLTLNRPKALNAMSRLMCREIQAANADIAQDDDIKVVVIKANGEKAFSAGTDTKDLALPGANDYGRTFHEACDSIRHLLKPVVCAVHGYCLGSGFLVMLSSDLAVAAENALFSMPEINIGLASNTEAVLFTKTSSIFRAKEICFMGDYIDAVKAEKYGLVNEVVPMEKLYVRANEIAAHLATKDMTALRVQKDIINKWLETDINTAIDYSILAERQCKSTKY